MAAISALVVWICVIAFASMQSSYMVTTEDYECEHTGRRSRTPVPKSIRSEVRSLVEFLLSVSVCSSEAGKLDVFN